MIKRHPLASSVAITLGVLALFLTVRHYTIDRAVTELTAIHNQTITVNPDPIETAIANGVPPCATDEVPEDGSACYWQASTRGNHRGHDYIANHGHHTWESPTTH